MRNQKAKGKKCDHCNPDKNKKRKWSASYERKGRVPRVKQGTIKQATHFSSHKEVKSELLEKKGRGGQPCYLVTFCNLISKVCPRNPFQEKL